MKLLRMVAIVMEASEHLLLFLLDLSERDLNHRPVLHDHLLGLLILLLIDWLKWLIMR